MILLVLLPGPEATHICVRLLHVECSNSQGRPVSIQCGPLVFGETSPRLVEAKAATKDPLPIGLFASYSLLSSISFSSIRLAKPLLSPEISWFVLFIDVGWTANQLITPLNAEQSFNYQDLTSHFWCYCLKMQFSVYSNVLVLPRCIICCIKNIQLHKCVVRIILILCSFGIRIS